MSETAPKRSRLPGLVAGLVFFVGAVNVGSGLVPGFSSRLKQLAPTFSSTVTGAANATTVTSGIILLMLAAGLRRRKRRAWRAAVFLLFISVVSHIIKGLDYEEAAVALLGLVALIATRKEFIAKGDPRTRWRAVTVGVGLLLGSVVLGMLMLRFYDDPITGPHGFWREVRFVLLGIVGVHGPIHFVEASAAADRVDDLLGGLGVLTFLTIAYLALRPSEPVASLKPDEEEQLRAMLAKHGDEDSLGYFALRRDKSVVFSPSGKSAIAYRVLSGTLLCSGDPLGDIEAWPGAITEMLALADEHGWTPAVMGCSERAAGVYERMGLNALELGDEAVVEVEDFTLEGRAMRGVRQAVAKVERAGYTCDVRRVGDLTVEERAHIVEQARAWRSTETERGFSMALGRFGDAADDQCVIVTASQEGRIRAFLHFVPWGRDGLSLDLMRRDKTAENGLNEYLITSALQSAPTLGVARVSLNFAVFRAALERGERIGAGPISRGFRWLLVFVSRWFQIDTLYRFNAKFRPIWEPRYICYPGAGDIPRVGLAALEAEAFIVWPMSTLRRRLGLKPKMVTS